MSIEKTVWFLRHAQADHNIFTQQEDKEKRKIGFALKDPHLTKLGRDSLAKVKLNETPDLVLFSPLKRTIETTLIVLKDLWKNRRENGVKFEPCPGIQERNAGLFPCDTGSLPKDLEKEYPNFVKFAEFLKDDWFDVKQSEYKKRYEKFVVGLQKRKENKIVLVAHKGTFINIAHGIVLKNSELLKFKFSKGKFSLSKEEKK